MSVLEESIKHNSIPRERAAAPAALQESKPKTRTKKPRWQERLLPLMAGMLIALTLFFFLATFIQLAYLNSSILRSPPNQLDAAGSEALVVAPTNFEDLFELRQFEVRAAMEQYIVEKRYHHASVQLMSGLWLRYLGFMTGMILALIGAAFILGKLREPEQELGGKFSDIAISLRTTSPGIILAVLGVILMFTTLVDRDVYKIEDANTYFSGAPAEKSFSGTNILPLPPLEGEEDLELDMLPDLTGPAPTANEQSPEESIFIDGLP